MWWACASVEFGLRRCTTEVDGEEEEDAKMVTRPGGWLDRLAIGEPGHNDTVVSRPTVYTYFVRNSIESRSEVAGIGEFASSGSYIDERYG